MVWHPCNRPVLCGGPRLHDQGSRRMLLHYGPGACAEHHNLRRVHLGGNQDGHARRGNISGEVIDICAADLALKRALEVMMKHIRSYRERMCRRNHVSKLLISDANGIQTRLPKAAFHMRWCGQIDMPGASEAESLLRMQRWMYILFNVGTKGKMEKPVAGLQRGCAIAH